MRHHILFYEYVEDVLERRGPHREAHLAALRAEHDAGRLVMAGALGDPPHGAAIVFGDVGREAIEAFLERDPYVAADVVRHWSIEPWNVVV